MFAPAAKQPVHARFRLASAHIDGTTVSRMRHVWTLIAAVVIAPLAWVLLAFGQDRSLQAFVDEEATGAFRNGDFIRPVLCLAAAGLLLGLLGTLRFSPAGAVLTGLAYTTSYLTLLANPGAVLNLIPGRVSLAGRAADLETPLSTGSAMVLGAALLLAVASAGRWRRVAVAKEEDAPAPHSGPPTPRSGPLTLPEDRPLGADGLGRPAAPLSGELLDGVPVRGDLGPDSGPEWSRVPVTPGWSNQRPEASAHAAQREGRWRELSRDSGPESRRWPTVR
jgi:hypothetical protein